MSTNDVPGHNPIHRDELAMGCWADHEDGSLIFVESCEGGQVIYSVFDLAGPDPIEYRDSMHEGAFKKAFSWTDHDDDDDGDYALPWTWHDKTPFPWERVLESGIKAGARAPSADHIFSAAERVALSRKMKRRDFDYQSALTKAGNVGKTIVDKVQRAILELRT